MGQGNASNMSINFATPKPSRSSSPHRPILAVTTNMARATQKPLTPPLSALTATSMANRPPPPEVLAVNELLHTMKTTLSALGKTFDTLGEQATKVAELGPAMEATHQVSMRWLSIDPDKSHLLSVRLFLFDTNWRRNMRARKLVCKKSRLYYVMCSRNNLPKACGAVYI